MQQSKLINDSLLKQICNRYNKCDSPVVLYALNSSFINIRPEGFIRLPANYVHALGDVSLFNCFLVDGGIILSPYMLRDESDLFQERYSRADADRNMELSTDLNLAENFSKKSSEFELRRYKPDNRDAAWKDINRKPVIHYYEDSIVNIDSAGDVIIPSLFLSMVEYGKNALCILTQDVIFIAPINDIDPNVNQYENKIGNCIFIDKYLLSTKFIRELTQKINTETDPKADDLISNIIYYCEKEINDLTLAGTSGAVDEYSRRLAQNRIRSM